MTFEIEIKPGETVEWPGEIVQRLSPGRWLVTVQPHGPANGPTPFRVQSAFLESYAPKDEGLYDDAPTR
jgi:hypothetical protein